MRFVKSNKQYNIAKSHLRVRVICVQASVHANVGVRVCGNEHGRACSGLSSLKTDRCHETRTSPDMEKESREKLETPKEYQKTQIEPGESQSLEERSLLLSQRP